MKPIKKRESLSRQVFEQLKQQIITGKWEPGEKIPSENELSEMLNVSRVTIREALQTLVALDLLEKKQGEGTFVKELSGETYIDALLPTFVNLKRSKSFSVHEYRKIIEVGAIELVVERVTEEDIVELKKILDNMIKYKDDLERFALEDLNFHLTLCQITKNPIIEKANFLMKDYLKDTMLEIIKSMGSGDGIRYHGEIIKAIENKDKEAAKELMEKHLDNNLNYI
ncbi:MAG: FadR family transcriptional regulator [Firmicutes bacterium]|nr:FadR family transcriptional regulator [Bacillota bacterium]